MSGSEAAAPAAEESLALATRAGIHTIALPTPFLVGRVNCYLIDDDPLTLVDTGPNSGKSLDALEQALAQHGRAIEELELIVLTHQHMDHVGLLEILARRSGAQIAALHLLGPYLESFPVSAAADDEFAEAIMRRHGVPEDVITALSSVGAAFRAFGSSGRVTRALHDGDELRFKDRSLRVLHRPGHSPSDTVFWDEQRRMLIAGDHLLAHISSNPLVSRPLAGAAEPPAAGAAEPPAGGAAKPATGGAAKPATGGAARPATGRAAQPEGQRTRALIQYIDSMRATRELPARLVLTGHGEPISDHARLIDERLRMHQRRARKILRMLAEGPLTAYEIAFQMWGNVAVTQAFLTLSEVLGHLDLLAEAGHARECGDGGVVRFEALARR